MAGVKLRSHEGDCSNRSAEGKVERFPHKGLVPTSTHHPARAGGGWKLRLRLWSSDPRERTGVGCMKTA